jgi:hypothetical protein
MGARQRERSGQMRLQLRQKEAAIGPIMIEDKHTG